VPLIFARSVTPAAILLACSTPTRDNPVAPATTRDTDPVVAASRDRPPPSARPSALPNVKATESARPESATGSAYFGCGKPIPAARLWDETTESQVLEAITVAKACAAEQGRRLMLEFVAPWCGDCREMAKVEATPLVEDIMRSRFERVRINIGKWDRHEGLRKTHEVRALATYVVIDPKTSKVLAKTTLEPVTGRRGKVSPEQWAAWLQKH
jgi:hypothetical protein